MRMFHGSCVPIRYAVLTTISTIAISVICSSSQSSNFTDLAYYICGEETFSQNSLYKHNLDSLLTNLLTQSSFSLYNATSVGSQSSSDVVYGIIQCRGDLSLPDCHSCISHVTSINIPQNCSQGKSLQIWLEGCYLEYQNESFMGVANFSTILVTKNANNNTDYTFKENVDSAMGTVTAVAPGNVNYYDSTAVGETPDRIYALAQCFGYLSQPDCSECLSYVINKVNLGMNNFTGGRVYMGSCYARYEVYDFIESSTSALPPAEDEQPKGHSKTTEVVVVTVAVTSASIVIIVFAVVRYIHHRKTGIDPDLQATQYTLRELERATDMFDHANKLGEGGFGPVYKGRLDNGRLVAIKKLSSSSQQGVTQFLNEVKIITSVQHCNLISLLGCCVEGSEKMLVYEYMPKGSLDKHLFGSPSVVLSWNTRVGIVLGTAKGLAYLHNESRVRIVHRDIKAGNILLYDDMTPKISDFGLARLFDDNVSRVVTAVAGTWGYLAPEYVMHGKLTDKADTFSFGLLTLEIVTGRRNLNPQLAEGISFLEWVWTLYEQQCQLEIVDPRLGGQFSADQVLRVIHVALLCAQMQAELRPSMSNVVTLLTSQSEILDLPRVSPLIKTFQHITSIYTGVNSHRDEIPLSSIMASSIAQSMGSLNCVTNSEITTLVPR